MDHKSSEGINDLIETVYAYLKLLYHHNGNDIIQNLLEEFMDWRERSGLGFFGDTRAGKSTLINNLLRLDILPTSDSAKQFEHKLGRHTTPCAMEVFKKPVKGAEDKIRISWEYIDSAEWARLRRELMVKDTKTLEDTIPLMKDDIENKQNWKDLDYNGDGVSRFLELSPPSDSQLFTEKEAQNYLLHLLCAQEDVHRRYLLKYLKVQGAFPNSQLSEGISLFDVPGSLDNNPTRVKERQKVLQKCRFAVTVISQEGAFKDKSAPMLQELRDITFGKTSLFAESLFVLTHNLDVNTLLDDTKGNWETTWNSKAAISDFLHIEETEERIFFIEKVNDNLCTMLPGLHKVKEQSEVSLHTILPTQIRQKYQILENLFIAALHGILGIANERHKNLPSLEVPVTKNTTASPPVGTQQIINAIWAGNKKAEADLGQVEMIVKQQVKVHITGRQGDGSAIKALRLRHGVYTSKTYNDRKSNVPLKLAQFCMSKIREELQPILITCSQSIRTRLANLLSDLEVSLSANLFEKQAKWYIPYKSIQTFPDDLASDIKVNWSSDAYDFVMLYMRIHSPEIYEWVSQSSPIPPKATIVHAITQDDATLQQCLLYSYYMLEAWNDCFTGWQWLPIWTPPKKTEPLQLLNISPTCYGALTPKQFFGTLRTFLEPSTVTSLKLQFHCLSDWHLPFVEDILVSCPKIKDLDITGNFFTDKSLTALKQKVQLVSPMNGLPNERTSTLHRVTHRIAVVIGNSAYTVKPLAACNVTAQNWRNTLSALGFKVWEKSEIRGKDWSEMRIWLNNRINEIYSGNHATTTADIVVCFFFAGHGGVSEQTPIVQALDGTSCSLSDIYYTLTKRATALFVLETCAVSVITRNTYSFPKDGLDMICLASSYPYGTTPDNTPFGEILRKTFELFFQRAAPAIFTVMKIATNAMNTGEVPYFWTHSGEVDNLSLSLGQ